jgi:hypothetical protein
VSFAIAITLLVLEIHAPTPRRPIVSGSGPRSRPAGPRILAYLISFVTIGIMWAKPPLDLPVTSADRIHVRSSERSAVDVHLVSAVPDGGARRVPARPEYRPHRRALLSLTLVVIAICYNAVWRYGVLAWRLVSHNADATAVADDLASLSVRAGDVRVSAPSRWSTHGPSLAIHGLLVLFFRVLGRHSGPSPAPPRQLTASDFAAPDPSAHARAPFAPRRGPSDAAHRKLPGKAAE